MLSVEDWAEIRRLRRSERLPISEIARVLKISRNTVKSALASDGPPKYQRAAKGSVADEAEPRIRELLAAYPRMPATVMPVAIGRRIEITADLSRVRVWCGGTLVADHDRIWAKHQTISDPEHVVAAKLLRRKRFDIVGPPHHVEVEQRLLTTYDTVLGLDGPVA